MLRNLEFSNVSNCNRLPVREGESFPYLTRKKRAKVVGDSVLCGTVCKFQRSETHNELRCSRCAD